MGIGPAALLAIAAAVPIPNAAPTTLPHYQGEPAAARPLRATKAPQNPYLALDPRSNIHNDNYAGLALGRDGTAYLGVIGGIVALREP